MAASEPHAPGGLEAGPHPKIERRANASPPPATSKRDKKRQLVTERLQALSEKFTRDKDVSYREQLQRIQIDTNLVMLVDPYKDQPLDVLGPTRRERQQGAPEGSGNDGRSLLEMAGPTFHQWYQEVEDLLEERDCELTKQKVRILPLCI
jgi:hypothetical protein